MKSKHIFILVGVIALIAILYYSMSDNTSQVSYARQIQDERDEKDRFMRTSSESPFADNREAFKGLNYFPIDEQYHVMAKLIPVGEKKARMLMTSDNKEQHYLEYAYAEFDLHGHKNRLLILEVMEMGPYRGTLFLSFADQTSAKETYGAGRYLDVRKVPGSSTLELDFNKAYNPYCAYIEKFSCPLPVRENLLSIPIYAGEKTYQ